MAEKKKEAKTSSKSAKTVKKPNKVVKYFKDLKSEFKKVVWPSRKTVVNNTGIVIATMVVSGLAIWGLDTVFVSVLKLGLSLGG